mgnify:FL=1
MTTDEINGYIHVEIMGKCWHRIDGCCDEFNQATTSHKLTMFGIPDYCSDASPRSLLNEVILQVVESGCRMPITEFFYGTDDGGVAVTATEIARACVEAHKTKCTTN